MNIDSPTTQSVDSVKALLSWKGRASDPLPEFVEMGEGESRLVLILSNKKDAYYVTTARACSCPAAAFNHGPCKHQRKYFNLPNRGGLKELAGSAGGLAAKKSTAAEPAARKVGKWPGGMNGPVPPEELEAHSFPAVPLIDTLGEPTPGELAYHSIKADRDLWPMVEA